MRVLAIGDVIGKTGVKRLTCDLPKLIKDRDIDFVIVNGENAGDGFGITDKQYKDILSSGADVITMGDHTWGKKDIFGFIDEDTLLRPANLGEKVPGKGYSVFEKNGKKICVISLIGRTFMSVLSNNPFECIDRILKKVEADIIIVDFHAEATAEKVAMARYLDGRVTCIYGTHTHIQTADEKILDKGTGYITDIGMTGPVNSVIGMDIEVSLKRFITSIPERYKYAEGPACINGCVFEINDENCKMEKIERVNI